MVHQEKSERFRSDFFVFLYKINVIHNAFLLLLPEQLAVVPKIKFKNKLLDFIRDLEYNIS